MQHSGAACSCEMFWLTASCTVGVQVERAEGTCRCTGLVSGTGL